MAFLRRNTLWLVGSTFFAIALVLTSDVLGEGRHVLSGEAYEGGLPYWVTWWIGHALAKNYDLFYNNFTLYPIKTNLLPILSFPTSALYMLLRPFLGSPLAFNALLPLYLGLDAWLSFAFFRRHFRNDLLAVIGGLIVAFNPLTFAFARRGEIALLGFWVLPLWMLLWDRLLEKINFRRLLLALVGLYLVVIMSAQFWNLILTLLLPYALMRGWKTARRERQLGDLLLAGGLLFGLLCLIYPAVPLIRSTYAETYSALEVWQGAGGLSGAGWLILAYGGLLGAIVALLGSSLPVDKRRWDIGVLGVNLLCYWQISLAPLTLIGGLGGVPYNPKLTQNKPFVIPLLLIGGLLALPLVERGLNQYFLQPHPLTPSPQAERGKKAITMLGFVVLALGVISVSGWLGEVPTSPVQDYAFYQTLADDPEDYVIIDFPLAADSLARRQVGERDTYAGFYFAELAGRTLMQIPIHQKRVVGGLTDALHDTDLAPYRELPLIRLLAFEPFSAQDTQAIIDLRNEVQRQRIGYVILHDPEGAIPPEFIDSIRGWLNWTGAFCLVGGEGDIEFWRARWHPAGCPAYTVHLGGADGLLATGDNAEGWLPPQFVDGVLVRPAGGGQISRFTLWVNNNNSRELYLRGRAAEGLDEQHVVLRVNGKKTSEFTLKKEWTEFGFYSFLWIGEVGRVELEFEHELANDGGLTAYYEWVGLSQ